MYANCRENKNKQNIKSAYSHISRKHDELVHPITHPRQHSDQRVGIVQLRVESYPGKASPKESVITITFVSRPRRLINQ